MVLLVFSDASRLKANRNFYAPNPLFIW